MKKNLIAAVAFCDDAWHGLRYALFGLKKVCHDSLILSFLLFILRFRLFKLGCKFDYLSLKLDVLLLKCRYLRFNQRYFPSQILWERDVRKDFFHCLKYGHFISSENSMVAAIETPNALGEGRERGILREASSGEAATSTDGLGATARD